MSTHVLVLFAANVWLGQWTSEASGTVARLRGLSVVNEDVAWASGSGATCLRTINGGKTWDAWEVPGASGLDFRDIHAVDARTAYLLSIGPGEKSRIYKTDDGGVTWTLSFTNRDPQGFLDAIAFWDNERGLALGDPLEGRFLILATDDGGKHWSRISPDGMPTALAGEGAFAASGTCLVVGVDGHAWFGTGGARVARVFRSTDRGRTWTAAETPVRAGSPSAGIFSLAFWDADHGIAVGGDYKKPDEAGRTAARTSDGGRTWIPVPGNAPVGYRSAVALVPGSAGPTLIAVGPGGTDLSPDAGANWRSLRSGGFDAAAFVSPRVGWAVGEDGRIARFAGQVLQAN